MLIQRPLAQRSPKNPGVEDAGVDRHFIGADRREPSNEVPINAGILEAMPQSPLAVCNEAKRRDRLQF